MSDRKRCCCNCERNIRREVAAHGIECYCEIDGHRIGYIECFEGWCRRWKKDHTFDGMDEPEEGEIIERECNEKQTRHPQ